MGWISFCYYAVRNGVYVVIAIGSSIGGIVLINRCVEGVMAMFKRSLTQESRDPPVLHRVRGYVRHHSEKPASNKTCSKSPFSIPPGGHAVTGTPKRENCCDRNNDMTNRVNPEKKSAEVRRNSAGPTIPGVIRGNSAYRPITSEVPRGNSASRPIIPEASVDNDMQHVPDQLHKIMPKCDADNLDIRCLRDDPCQNEEKKRSPPLLNFFEIYNACVRKKRVFKETAKVRAKTAK